MKLSNLTKVCICLQDDQNRVNYVNDYMTSQFDDLYIKYVYRQPSFKPIYKDLNFNFPGQLGCAMSHYDQIYEAYHKNYEYILICEDDIEFNKEQIQLFLDNAPEDFDILQFYALDTRLPDNNTIYKEDLQLEYNQGIYWHRVSEHCTRWGTVFYILNRKGMEYYINLQSDILRLSDTPFILSYNYDINHYIPTLRLINETDLKTTVSAFY